MTTREAVKLVMEALLVGKNGETLVLDMGAPVSILEVAKRMIRSSGRSIQIEISNLNPGEKVHEQLLGRSEEVVVRGNPRIFHTKVKPLEEFLHG
jgi:dTDP-glucose 4,6-dehydratase